MSDLENNDNQDIGDLYKSQRKAGEKIQSPASLDEKILKASREADHLARPEDTVVHSEHRFNKRNQLWHSFGSIAAVFMVGVVGLQVYLQNAPQINELAPVPLTETARMEPKLKVLPMETAKEKRQVAEKRLKHAPLVLAELEQLRSDQQNKDISNSSSFKSGDRKLIVARGRSSTEGDIAPTIVQAQTKLDTPATISSSLSQAASIPESKNMVVKKMQKKAKPKYYAAKAESKEDQQSKMAVNEQGLEKLKPSQGMRFRSSDTVRDDFADKSANNSASSEEMKTLSEAPSIIPKGKYVYRKTQASWLKEIESLHLAASKKSNDGQAQLKIEIKLFKRTFNKDPLVLIQEKGSTKPKQ